MDKNDTSLIMYVAEDGVTRIQATFDRDTVWLSIDQMAELFQRDKSVIGKHVRSIFSEGELNKNSVWAKFAYTAADGKTYQVDYYNSDVIISVGYRVKSIRGTQFRIWALQVLREYLLKGGSVNQRIDSLERRVSRTEEKIDFFVRTSLPPVEGIFFQGQIFDFFLIFLIIIRSLT
ncbi:virulence RhuM family protein [bacterium]|nr:virulence RhuM family protein [bacterium]